MRENNKLRIAMFAGAVAGLSITAFPGSAVAQQSWTPTVYKVLGADPNDLARVNYEGRLRKTDEEFTNEQAVVKFFADGKRALFVQMRTGALDSGETPVNRMQGSCTPLELIQNPDGSLGFQKLPGEKFISKLRGNEYRQFNKPELMPINNGKNMLVMFNWQPEGTNDTRRYAKVLDENCNEIPIVDGNGQQRTQVQIMAKNNDDCDMHQTGEGPCDIASDANGVTHLTCWAGCNGNGRDDGWLNDITVSCQNGPDGKATSCQIRKNFDISLAQREERSRGRCTVADEDPNTAICTWTEGNTQPQRDGTWIAAVDISPNGEKGPDAQSRLLWKEMIDGRKRTARGERTYSVRAMHTRVLIPNADGTLTRSNMIFFRSGDLEGRNNNNRKGGMYRAFQVGVIKATRTGMEWVLPLTDTTDMFLGIDGTHLTMCGAVFGEGSNLMPGFTLMQGSHNGGGVTEPVVKTIAFDMANKKLVDLGTHRVGGSYDRHLYANYLGNNPGNQGRNFAGCTLVKNPYAGVNGNKAAYFVAHALTGKAPEDLSNAALKPSSYLTLLPVAQIAPPPPPATDPPSGGTTTDPAAGGDTQTGSGEEQPAGSETPTAENPTDAPDMATSGCSVAAGATTDGGAFLLVVFGLGFVALVRRRRA